MLRSLFGRFWSLRSSNVSKMLVKSVALMAAICLVVVSATPLDDYVNKPDNTYKWEMINSVRGLNFTAYNIKLTSQTWMNPSVVSISVWTHWLQICIPDDVRKFPVI